MIKNHKKTFNQEDDAPEPLGEEGWLDLNLPVQLMRNLIHLKMAKPTPIQRIACPGKAFSAAKFNFERLSKDEFLLN